VASILIIQSQIIMNKSPRINYWSVIITGIIAFMLSLIWYSPFVFGKIWMEYRNTPAQSAPSWTMIFAPLREITASYIIAIVITRLTITDWKKAVELILLLWLAFHAVGMAGAIIWDNMPWQLGLVHAGDWLMKMIFMAVVLSLWHHQKLIKT
jgi:hypothetical protein